MQLAAPKWIVATGRQLERPLVCLVLLGVILAAFWISTYRAGGFGLKYMPDSVDYQSISEASLSPREILSATRPPVYPAILSLARLAGASYSALPYIQYAIFGLAVLTVFACGIHAGLKAWEALLIAGPITGASIIREYGAYMLTEATGTAFAIMAIALSFLVAAKGPSRLRNTLLGVSVLSACLVRPAFLFLAFAPLVILLASPSFRSSMDRPKLMGEFVANTAAAALPLFLYAVLRLMTVGHFGVVSYGAVNIAGIATNAEMLTESSVPRLHSPELEGLARAILQKRRDVAAKPDSAVPAYVYDEAAVRDSPIVKAWSESYNATVWNVSVPATRAYYHASPKELLNPDWIKVNDRLGKLSSALLSNQFPLYVKWVVLSARDGFRNVFYYEAAGRWGIGLAFILLIAVAVTRAFMGSVKGFSVGTAIGRRWIMTSLVIVLVVLFNAEGVQNLMATAAGAINGTVLGSLFPLSLMFCGLVFSVQRGVQSLMARGPNANTILRPALAYVALVFLFFIMGLALVVLVEPPAKRYLMALSPMLPGAILLLSARILITVWPRELSIKAAK